MKLITAGEVKLGHYAKAEYPVMVCVLWVHYLPFQIEMSPGCKCVSGCRSFLTSLTVFHFIMNSKFSILRVIVVWHSYSAIYIEIVFLNEAAILFIKKYCSKMKNDIFHKRKNKKKAYSFTFFIFIENHL